MTLLRCPVQDCVYMQHDDEIGRQYMADHVGEVLHDPPSTTPVNLTTGEAAMLARSLRSYMRKRERQRAGKDAREGAWVREPGKLDADEIALAMAQMLMDKLLPTCPRNFNPDDGGRNARQEAQHKARHGGES